MKLAFIQAFRGVAASLVAIDHALCEITGNNPHLILTHIAWSLGSFGVYLFFVISGFIMAQISWDEFGTDGASKNFIVRRLIRIVPIYWLTTIVALICHQISPNFGMSYGLKELIYSFLFIPNQNPNGVWAPILAQGWTLSYEMMFYSIFAVSLLFRRTLGLILVSGLLALMVAFGSSSQPNGIIPYLCSPIVLWFLLGIALAVIWKLMNLKEPRWLAVMSEPLNSLGNASYSIYLAQGFLISATFRVWERVIGSPSPWFVPLSVALCLIGGSIIHMTVERPILRISNELLRSKRMPIALAR